MFGLHLIASNGRVVTLFYPRIWLVHRYTRSYSWIARNCLTTSVCILPVVDLVTPPCSYLSLSLVYLHLSRSSLRICLQCYYRSLCAFIYSKICSPCGCWIESPRSTPAIWSLCRLLASRVGNLGLDTLLLVCMLSVTLCSRLRRVATHWPSIRHIHHDAHGWLLARSAVSRVSYRYIF